MPSELLGQLQAAAPVESVDAEGVVSFIDSATDEERAAAANIVEAWKDSRDKRAAFESAVTAGFDTGLGFRLAIDEAGRKAFTELRTQLIEGIEFGLLTNDSQCPVKVSDVDGGLHQLTVGQVRQLIFAGGNYYAGLLASYRG
jgi:hypothetical protein